MLRGVAALSLATAAVGISFGAITVGSGLSGWVAIAMSVLIHAGGAQFVAVGLISAGNPFAAVFAGLLLNARHLPFGLALGDTLGNGWRSWLVASHFLSDESFAFAMSYPEGPQRRRGYWLIGLHLSASWIGGTALGVLLGGAAGDPNALGLDAAFPAGLLALLLPSMADQDTRRVTLVGASLAVLSTPFLPAGIPVLLSMTGLLIISPAPARRAPARHARPAYAPRHARPAYAPRHARTRKAMVPTRQKEE